MEDMASGWHFKGIIGTIMAPAGAFLYMSSINIIENIGNP